MPENDKNSSKEMCPLSQYTRSAGSEDKSIWKGQLTYFIYVQLWKLQL